MADKPAFHDGGSAAFVHGLAEKYLSPETRQKARNTADWMENHDLFPSIPEIPGKIAKAVKGD